MATFLHALSFALALALATTLAAAQAEFCQINSICFALDQSPSISRKEYARIQDFTIGVANALAARTSRTLYSAFGFSLTANTIQTGTMDLAATFIPAVLKSMPHSPHTNIYEGITACFDEVVGDPGNRVIVLLTDGVETRGEPSISLVPQIRAAGVSLVSVAVGDKTDVDNLQQLATRPDFFIQTTFQTLPDDAVIVTDKSCEVVDVPKTPIDPPTNGGPAPPTAAPPAIVIPNPMTGGPTCDKAADKCDFKFHGVIGVPMYNANGPADRHFSAKVVSKKDEILGVLNTNDVIPQFIGDNGTAKNVTMYGMPSFDPTAFKPFPLRSGRHSGVGHQTWHGDQSEIVRNKCVRLYFTSYQTLSDDRYRNVVGNMHVTMAANKCVVFRTV